MGTRINDLQVTKVVDGDTIKVNIDGTVESLRLICLDTEESWAGGSKPVTIAGKMASEMAKQYFTNPGGELAKVDIEFDTDDPIEVCFKKHRGNFGRLICFVHKDGENYNLKTIREGFSPYFVKYGRVRNYHREMMEAEAEAQSNNLVIWDPTTNGSGDSRDYKMLLPWWETRALAVEDYRKFGAPAGVFSVRLNYEEIVTAAEEQEKITVFCDLQGGINKWIDDNALVYAGSIHHKFNLWIPDTDNESTQKILHLLEKRYIKTGRGYLYVSGKAEKFGNTPQIEITDVRQLSDFSD